MDRLLPSALMISATTLGSIAAGRIAKLGSGYISYSPHLQAIGIAGAIAGAGFSIADSIEESCSGNTRTSTQLRRILLIGTLAAALLTPKLVKSLSTSCYSPNFFKGSTISYMEAGVYPLISAIAICKLVS